MKKRDIEEFIMDYIDGKITSGELEKILAASDEYKGNLDEVEKLKELYNRLDYIPAPEPGENMDKSFYNMLESIKAVNLNTERNTGSISNKIFNLFKVVTLPRISYASLLLIIGILIGKWALPENNESKFEKMSAELKSMKEVMMLTLLQQPSPTERIKAVNSVNSISDVDNKVVNALIETLNTDPNVNVRLSTIEVLAGFAQNPQVRQGLIQSISSQKSPLVQIALADLMVSLREKKSIDPLKKLLADKEIKYSVKTKIEDCIANI